MLIFCGWLSKEFWVLLKEHKEIFRQKSARIYEERRTLTTIQAIRSDEVNRSRRRKISAPEAKTKINLKDYAFRLFTQRHNSLASGTLKIKQKQI